MRLLPAILLLLAQGAPEPVTPEEFEARRTRLAERFSDGPVVIDTAPLGEVGSDSNVPLLDFRYLTGFHNDHGILVLTGREMSVFTDTDAFSKWAAGQPPEIRLIHAKLHLNNLTLLRKTAPQAVLETTRVSEEVSRMRLVKSEAEVRMIRKATNATVQAFEKVMRSLRPGMNEKSVEKIVRDTFRREGCPEVGFLPICAGGPNATTLHYHANNRDISDGELLLCDIGAAFEGYTSDVTRTLPVSGRFTKEQRKLYTCLVDAQKAAEAVLRPGVTFADLDQAACEVFVVQGLTQWSYARTEDTASRHYLGHHVGLSPHDPAMYREKFEPGMVITIEPGWYDRTAGCGLRLEDIYLVTPDGFERLSAGAPREMTEIELAMAIQEKD